MASSSLDAPGEIRFGSNSARIVVGKNRLLVVNNVNGETGAQSEVDLRPHDALFGDGSDGAEGFNIEGDEIVINRDMYYTDLNVRHGGTLTTNGHRVFVRGTLYLEGTGKISCSGRNGGNGSTEGPGLGGASGGPTAGGGGDGGVPNNLRDFGIEAGETGGNSDNAIALADGGDGGIQIGHRPGATGGRATLVPPERGGSKVLNSAALTSLRDLGNQPITGGCGGAGGFGAIHGGRGGGGGGGGGVLLVAAATILGTGTIVAAGGNGGNGGGATNMAMAGAGGGGGGGGGLVVVISKNFGEGFNESKITAPGGLGGAGGAGSPTGPTGLPGSAGAVRIHKV